MQELFAQLIRCISHIDISTLVRSYRDFVLVIKFVDIEITLYFVEGQRLVRDVRATQSFWDAGK